MRAPIVVLEPGDRVLVSLHDSTGPDGLERIVGQFRERFPGVVAAFVTGIDVLVQPKEPKK
jgi:hypothetical protein